MSKKMKTNTVLAKKNAGSGKYMVLVRGARLRCDCGSHCRSLNLPKSHGIYVGGNSHPVCHEYDCEVGENGNIRSFGICSSSSRDGIPIIGDALNFVTGKTVLLAAEPVYNENGELINDGENIRGLECTPDIVGCWNLSRHYTNVAKDSAKSGFAHVNSELGDLFEDVTGWELSVPSTLASQSKVDGKIFTYGRAVDTHSFLLCRYGGIISPYSDGQEYEDPVG